MPSLQFSIPLFSYSWGYGAKTRNETSSRQQLNISMRKTQEKHIHRTTRTTPSLRICHTQQAPHNYKHAPSNALQNVADDAADPWDQTRCADADAASPLQLQLWTSHIPVASIVELILPDIHVDVLSSLIQELDVNIRDLAGDRHKSERLSDLASLRRLEHWTSVDETTTFDRTTHQVTDPLPEQNKLLTTPSLPGPGCSINKDTDISDDCFGSTSEWIELSGGSVLAYTLHPPLDELALSPTRAKASTDAHMMPPPSPQPHFLDKTLAFLDGPSEADVPGDTEETVEQSFSTALGRAVPPHPTNVALSAPTPASILPGLEEDWIEI